MSETPSAPATSSRIVILRQALVAQVAPADDPDGAPHDATIVAGTALLFDGTGGGWENPDVFLYAGADHDRTVVATGVNFVASVSFEDAARLLTPARAGAIRAYGAFGGYDDGQPATDDVDTRYGESVEDLEADAVEWADASACPVCGGETTVLGALGARVHYRCRRCGADHSREAR